MMSLSIMDFLSSIDGNENDCQSRKNILPMTIQTNANTDGIFNRFVTVSANRARHASWELSLGRESMQLSSNVQSNYGGYPSKHIQ
jgi:hypothetical protein